MLETEGGAVSPAYPRGDSPFSGLKPGDRIQVHPSIPRHNEHREYQIQRLEAGRIVLRERLADQPLSIPAASVAKVHSARGPKPALLVLKGRLQWITATRQWMVLPEQPPADSEHGLHKLASSSDDHVVEVIERLGQQGYSAWWVPVDEVREFLIQGGEIIYDADGRYLRTRDQRSEWILLARRPEAAALP
ncbi:MAG TPA: hypothetical protein VGZ29_04295 [Terriglobia bacterium]|nr:hypothetical protein [Terriglobia bacterium]